MLKKNNIFSKTICRDKNIGQLITDRDGNLINIFGLSKKNISDTSQSSSYILMRKSYNAGSTWTVPETVAEFPYGNETYIPIGVIRTKDDYIHIFTARISWYDFRNNDFKGDIVHTKINELGKDCKHLKISCLDRYTGSQNNIIQLESGRILVPFSTILHKENIVNFISNTIYSDDEGENWYASNDIEISDGESYCESGALEPVVLELEPNRILIIIRTTLGRFYKCISEDGGATWCEPAPTDFLSSNSPANIIRMPSGNLVMLWNNCCGLRYRSESNISYARQVLHAAVSEDNGNTWEGSRTIYKRPDDETYNVDYSYPYVCLDSKGELLVTCWEVNSKKGGIYGGDENAILLKVNVENLKQKKMYDDFKEDLGIWVISDKNVQIIDIWNSKIMEIKPCKGNIAVASVNFPFSTSGIFEIKLKTEGSKGNIKFILSEYFIDPHNFTEEYPDKKELLEKILNSCCCFNLFASNTFIDEECHKTKFKNTEWNILRFKWSFEEKTVKILDIENRVIRKTEVPKGITGFNHLTVKASCEGNDFRLLIGNVSEESYCSKQSDLTKQLDK